MHSIHFRLRGDHATLDALLEAAVLAGNGAATKGRAARRSVP